MLTITSDYERTIQLLSFYLIRQVSTQIHFEKDFYCKIWELKYSKLPGKHNKETIFLGRSESLW